VFWNLGSIGMDAKKMEAEKQPVIYSFAAERQNGSPDK
jgi:hypothetical protein